MAKFNFSVAIGLNGCHIEDTIELEDNLTDEEVQEMYLDWRDEQLDGGWDRE
ncbi:DUF7167 family protein [Planococcus beigongshangi]|uniref:DUF7167 family protein n=1 Tax=Planococcus beigongshangi TaxID=2782536 RepID=UPI00193B08E3|nr:hypothetical protein [Planococcus beigongshangi]